MAGVDATLADVVMSRCMLDASISSKEANNDDDDMVDWAVAAMFLRSDLNTNELKR
jgi:hypothetical protein